MNADIIKKRNCTEIFGIIMLRQVILRVQISHRPQQDEKDQMQETSFHCDATLLSEVFWELMPNHKYRQHTPPPSLEQTEAASPKNTKSCWKSMLLL